MRRTDLLRALALAAPLALPAAADAHGIAGARVFVSTLQLDDPAVADEAAVPTFTWAPQSGTAEYDLNVSFAKRITDNFGVSVSLGHAWLVQRDKTRNGWQNIDVGAKYQVYVNAQHEFMLSVGVDRELPRTGTRSIGADTVGTTTPSITWGKGFGDLPISALRPFALTGQLGYAFSDRALKQFPDGTDNAGHENRLTGGLSLQY
jgi:hypothetical protein